MKKRILVCEFRQENNTFNPIVTQIDRFDFARDFEGDRIYQQRLTDKSSIQGAVGAFTQMGAEAVPTIYMHCGSGGRIADEAFSHFCRRIRHHAETVGDFDAIYASLHGATCTESVEDVCGEVLALLRTLAGDKPVVASCDLHAKITEKMLKNADFICGYQTYPHVDLYQTGYRVGKLCMQMLRGEKAACGACFVPMLVPPAGYTDKSGAFGQLMDRAKAMVAAGELLDFSIFVVQPWLDVSNIASCVLTVAKDPQTAKEKAQLLAQGLCDIREDMWPELVAVDEIIDIAQENQTGKPVILADSADSPNGGAVGDSPAVLLRLLERGSKLKVAMAIRDPAAVQQAFDMGVGAQGEFTLGASLTPGIPGPAKAVATVVSLHENDIATGKQPAMGKTAVLQIGSIYVLVCQNGSSTRYPEIYRDFGIEPETCDLLVIKANTSFRAFYAPITDLIYVADTPGAGASNLRQLQWENIPDGTYPFTQQISPEPAIIW